MPILFLGFRIFSCFELAFFSIFISLLMLSVSFSDALFNLCPDGGFVMYGANRLPGCCPYIISGFVNDSVEVCL